MSPPKFTALKLCWLAGFSREGNSMTEPSDNSVQKLWQSQPVEVTRMSAEVLRKRARKLEHRVWWRNAREYVGTVVGVALFGNFLWKTHDILLRVAYALFM